MKMDKSEGSRYYIIFYIARDYIKMIACCTEIACLEISIFFFTNSSKRDRNVLQSQK